jgi:hypothetical protein
MKQDRLDYSPFQGPNSPSEDDAPCAAGKAPLLRSHNVLATPKASRSPANASNGHWTRQRPAFECIALVVQGGGALEPAATRRSTEFPTR